MRSLGCGSARRSSTTRQPVDNLVRLSCVQFLPKSHCLSENLARNVAKLLTIAGHRQSMPLQGLLNGTGCKVYSPPCERNFELAQDISMFVALFVEETNGHSHSTVLRAIKQYLR